MNIKAHPLNHCTNQEPPKLTRWSPSDHHEHLIRHPCSWWSKCGCDFTNSRPVIGPTADTSPKRTNQILAVWTVDCQLLSGVVAQAWDLGQGRHRLPRLGRQAKRGKKREGKGTQGEIKELMQPLSYSRTSFSTFQESPQTHLYYSALGF